MSTISLLSDLGRDSWEVGAVKGSMYDLYPLARIADVSHAPENRVLAKTARIIASAYAYFAYGSIHAVAIAPELGVDAQPILLESRGHYFLGLDNGMFSVVDHASSVLYALDKRAFWIRNITPAFHGLDIVGPVAAHLGRGVPADQLGTRLNRRLKKTAATPELGVAASRA